MDVRDSGSLRGPGAASSELRLVAAEWIIAWGRSHPVSVCLHAAVRHNHVHGMLSLMLSPSLSWQQLSTSVFVFKLEAQEVGGTI